MSDTRGSGKKGKLLATYFLAVSNVQSTTVYERYALNAATKLNSLLFLSELYICKIVTGLGSLFMNLQQSQLRTLG